MRPKARSPVASSKFMTSADRENVTRGGGRDWRFETRIEDSMYLPHFYKSVIFVFVNDAGNHVVSRKRNKIKHNTMQQDFMSGLF